MGILWLPLIKKGPPTIITPRIRLEDMGPEDLLMIGLGEYDSREKRVIVEFDGDKWQVDAYHNASEDNKKIANRRKDNEGWGGLGISHDAPLLVYPNATLSDTEDPYNTTLLFNVVKGNENRARIGFNAHKNLSLGLYSSGLTLPEYIAAADDKMARHELGRAA